LRIKKLELAYDDKKTDVRAAQDLVYEGEKNALEAERTLAKARSEFEQAKEKASLAEKDLAKLKQERRDMKAKLNEMTADYEAKGKI
jgi:hypothetical protein